MPQRHRRGARRGHRRGHQHEHAELVPSRGLNRARRGIIEPILLLGLRFGPAHGYSLLAKLENYELGPLDPSVVYRALREMESNDWVASSWDKHSTQGPPRRVYEITPAGREVLSAWALELERSQSRISKFLSEYEQGAS